MWSRVTAFRRLNVLLDRLSEFHFVIGEVNDLSTVTWNARQEIKPDSIFVSRPQDFVEEHYKDWARLRPFDHISLVASGQFGQAKFALSGVSIFPRQATSVDQKNE